MIILVYPFIFTCEELRYDYGFPHAEWRRNPQAPGTKSNIDNIEAVDSKNKISRKVDEPFITVTRKNKLETLFKQSGPEKEKPGDSEKRVASTTQRKGKESEVPVKEVSNLYPNLSAKNLTIPLQPVSLQSCNESINIEIQNATDTVEKAPNPLHNVAGDTEQRISTKSSQNQSSKVEKNKTTDTEGRLLTRYAKTGTRNRGSQQNHRKTNLAKLRNPKLVTQKRRLLTRYAKTGTRNRGFQQNHRRTDLAKLRKTKLLTQKRRLLTRYAKTGTRNRGSEQNHRKSNLAKLRKTKLLTQKRKLLNNHGNRRM